MKKDDVTEATLQKISSAPRVSPQDIEDNIKSCHFFSAYEGVMGEAFHHEDGEEDDTIDGEIPKALKLLTICVIVLQNGFTVIGHSACAAPENFNQEIGQKIAREKAIEQIWPLMGYELRSSLYQQASAQGQGAAGDRQPGGHDAVGTGEAEASLTQSLEKAVPAKNKDGV